MSDLQRRIEYIIEGEDDAESKAARIAAMIEQRDRHIAKLAGVGVAQEAEIVDLKRRVVEYAKAGLWDYVCYLSEQYWAATYQQGLMAAIKKAVTDPAADRRVWGRTQLSEAEIATLRRLSEDAGGWPDDDGGWPGDAL